MTERNTPDLRARSIRWLVLLLLLSLGASLGQLERPDRPSLSRSVPHDRGSAAIAQYFPISGTFQPDGPQPVQLDDARNVGVPDDWYNTITSDIAASEYHINWQENVGAYQSPNRKQDLRITYRADGFALTPRVADSTWSVALTLDRIGRPGAWLLPADSATLTTNGPALVADHGSFTVDYHNGEEGMRQNFTVRERPSGSGPLQVRLHTSGNLHAADMGDNAIAFCTATANGSSYTPTVWYKDLLVWDANGDTLQAAAMLEGEDVVISVNDALAEYPITVDPLSTTADWTAESNQAAAHFGQSVSSAGDVNGDGYSDVIIGAPEYDNGETDEGRAYVYFGSANGLISASPWSAEGNSIGALFGTAVSSAGDVNNDGYSDIVV
ncbi:MAG: integrin alpha, partial [Flavobacteriales bacterium]